MARILSAIGTYFVLLLAACGGQLSAWHHPAGYGEDVLVADLHLCHVQALTESSTFTTKQDLVIRKGNAIRGYSAPVMVQVVDDEIYEAVFQSCMIGKGWVEGKGPKRTAEEAEDRPEGEKGTVPPVETDVPPPVLPPAEQPKLHWDGQVPPGTMSEEPVPEPGGEEMSGATDAAPEELSQEAAEESTGETGTAPTQEPFDQ